MTNRIQQNPPSSSASPAAHGNSRFAMIEPELPCSFGATSPNQIHLIAFLHARALVERTRWQRLLEKIFQQDE
jgi:hypothetical protein